MKLPAGQNYVLVMYGGVWNEGAGFRDTLWRPALPSRWPAKSPATVSELSSYLAAVHTAKGIAKQEGISNILAYTSSD